MTDTLREPSHADHPPADRAAPQARRWWRVAPVDRRGLVVWVVAYVVMTALAIGAGYLLMHELGAVRSFDDRVAGWLARHRTDAWDDATLGRQHRGRRVREDPRDPAAECVLPVAVAALDRTCAARRRTRPRGLRLRLHRGCHRPTPATDRPPGQHPAHGLLPFRAQRRRGRLLRRHRDRRVLARTESPRTRSCGRRRVPHAARRGRLTHVPRHAPPQRRGGRARDRRGLPVGHLARRASRPRRSRRWPIEARAAERDA